MSVFVNFIVMFVYVGLNESFFFIRVIASVCDDDVIHKLDTHHVAGPLDTLCQVVVGLTGPETARWVVMADSQDGGVAEHGLADDDAHIDTYLRDAAVSNAQLFDETEVLIHQ